ncbi:hypothetical protein PMIN03_001129 [Paraphaeosphaeria minitans]
MEMLEGYEKIMKGGEVFGDRFVEDDEEGECDAEDGDVVDGFGWLEDTEIWAALE